MLRVGSHEGIRVGDKSRIGQRIDVLDYGLLHELNIPVHYSMNDINTPNLD